jgi:hypothetical protein
VEYKLIIEDFKVLEARMRRSCIVRATVVKDQQRYSRDEFVLTVRGTRSKRRFSMIKINCSGYYSHDPEKSSKR